MTTPVEQFVESLACRAVLLGASKIPFDDASTSRKLSRILAFLREKAVSADRQSDNEHCDHLLEIIEALSPDSNTGAYDNFLSSLRGLQPAFAGVWNPTLYALKLDIDSSLANRVFSSCDKKMQPIVDACAKSLAE